MRRDFRRVDSSRARVILIEGGPRLLAAFPQEISDRALADLRELGVEVRLNSVVSRIDTKQACIGLTTAFDTRTIFWAAGNARVARSAESLGAPLDRAGRVMVNPDLSIPDHPEVFVIGDMATLTDVRGMPVPWVAPAANQEGKRAAENIKLLLRDEDDASRSATSTKATSRRSVATRRWRTSEASAWSVGSRGGSGYSSTSCTWSASEIARACCCSGRIRTSRISVASG